MVVTPFTMTLFKRFRVMTKVAGPYVNPLDGFLRSWACGLRLFDWELGVARLVYSIGRRHRWHFWFRPLAAWEAWS